jgi:preprotein translocase YajC subunit
MPSADLLLAATKSSSSIAPMFIILALFAAVYFLVLRPRQKAQQRQRQTGTELEIGDEVITIGGVRGVVVAVSDELVTIATGQMPGDDPSAGSITHITFVRKAIGQKLPQPEALSEVPASADDAEAATPEATPPAEGDEHEGGSETP